jgi:hypothetical protein
MNDVYESIIRGLQEATDDASGKETLSREAVTVNTEKSDSTEDVKETR